MDIRVPVTIRVNGLPVRSVTWFSAVGAYVVVLATSTAGPRAGVSVTSTYVGHQSTDTHATHLVMHPGAEPRLDTRLHRAGDLAVDERQRRSLLYDHLDQVLAALRVSTRNPSIDVFEHAAEVLDS